LKNAKAKTILLILSISFVVVFIGILALSIAAVLAERKIDQIVAQQRLPNEIIGWLAKFTRFDIMKDPVSIFIQILTTIGGVFFGIRIGQWIDERRDKENLGELWEKTNRFLINLQTGINADGISIRELAEYKMYWDSLQHADSAATRLIQADSMYTEISYAFSFLMFYNHNWNRFNSVSEWINNAASSERQRIDDWIRKLAYLITYTENK